MISVFGAKISEKERSYLNIALDKNWLGYGDLCKSFEKRCSAELSLPHFVMVNSGTSALFLAIRALNLAPGSEVILPAFTYIGCATAVIANQLIPVFADVDPNTQNITAELINAKITARTKAIIIVHYAGLPVELEDILALNIPVIEDAAHAIGAMYKGKRCGTYGRIGTYSFDGTKNIAAGEGGGLCFNEESDSKLVKDLRLCGISSSGYDEARSGNASWWEEKMVSPGLRFIPSDLSGAIALGQLDSFQQNQDRRKYLWQVYDEQLKDIDAVLLPIPAEPGDEHGYFTYFIRLNDGRRNELIRYLFDNDVYSTVRYHPLHLTLPTYAQGALKNSEALAEEGLNIPLHPSVTDDQIGKIISLIKNFYKGNK